MTQGQGSGSEAAEPGTMEGTPRSASVSFAELSSGAIDSGTSKLSKANFWKVTMQLIWQVGLIAAIN